jgi:hypothetical protein
MATTPQAPTRTTTGDAPTAPAVPAAPPRWARWADAGLWAVACSGFALSYSSVQRAAGAHVDHQGLSYLLPVATDGAALAAAARYVADRRTGIGAARGWQLLAWAAIAASAALNALGRNWQDALWHLVGPGALAVITELYAHRAAQLHRSEQHRPAEAIPARLWLTTPLASARLWLWTARTGQRSLVAARREMGRHAAALEALDIDCPGRAYQRIRKIARRQLRSGALSPDAVLYVLGWDHDNHPPTDPPAALRALLAAALTPTHPNRTAYPDATTTVEVHVIDHPEEPPNSTQPNPEPLHRAAIEAGPVSGELPGESGGESGGPVSGELPGESSGELPGPVPASASASGAGAVPASASASGVGAVPASGVGAVPASASASGVGAVPASGVGAVPASASASGVGAVPASASASGVGAVPASGVGALTDAQILAAIHAAGQVPSTRSIQTTYHVGRPRADRLRAEALQATTHPTTTPGPSRVVSRSVTAEDLRSIPTVNGTRNHVSQEEAEKESQK